MATNIENVVVTKELWNFSIFWWENRLSKISGSDHWRIEIAECNASLVFRFLVSEWQAACGLQRGSTGKRQSLIKKPCLSACLRLFLRLCKLCLGAFLLLSPSLCSRHFQSRLAVYTHCTDWLEQKMTAIVSVPVDWKATQQRIS